MPRRVNANPNKQDPTMHRISFRLPIELVERLMVEAAVTHQTATAIAQVGIEAELERRAAKPIQNSLQNGVKTS